MSTSLLTDKVAVIYGTGTLGAGVARTFAREGAVVHLAGRNQTALDALAAEIGAASATVVDALDDAAVNAHLRGVGRVDVAFNLTSRGDVQGTPLLDMDVEDFLAPIATGARAAFTISRAAARVMAEQGSGVILMVTSASGSVLKPSPGFQMGGTGPADAAIESLLHYLAAEVGPRGVRVAGLWTAGVNYPDLMAGVSLLGRGPTLEQFADTAAFVASDRGSGITNAIVNVSSGVAAN
jgi:NAD(P)-dependent dehydrogenase (short-subunit alcohol dehydrogenase family)